MDKKKPPFGGCRTKLKSSGEKLEKFFAGSRANPVDTTIVLSRGEHTSAGTNVSHDVGAQLR